MAVGGKKGSVYLIWGQPSDSVCSGLQLQNPVQYAS